jgi:hypothetical protein
VASCFRYKGSGDGAFNSPPVTLLDISVGKVYGVVCVDFDDDGDVDIAALQKNNNIVSIMENKHTGTLDQFADELFTRTDIDLHAPMSCRGPDILVHGDFNSDGRTDLALICRHTSTAGWLPNLSGGDEDCEDDATWYKANTPSKTCDWVRWNTNNRCRKTGEAGSLASIGCPVTCATCR